jgi:hypothetical protein
VRRFLPDLIDLVWKGTIDPGKVFDLTLPLDRPERATAPWTNDVRSRPCSAHKFAQEIHQTAATLDLEQEIAP